MYYFSQKRPPRIKMLSFRRMMDRLLTSKETTKIKSSKAEALAKEIERRMKALSTTEGECHNLK